MEIYQMIYKKLEAFNNYKITNIILYKMLTIYMHFVNKLPPQIWYTERSEEGVGALYKYPNG